MNKVKSLAVLAAEVIPQDVELANLHEDVAELVEYNRITIKTCKHGTKWSCRRGKINGVVTYSCGCTQRWRNNMLLYTQFKCEYRRKRIWNSCSACVEWGVWCGVRMTM